MWTLTFDFPPSGDGEHGGQTQQQTNLQSSFAGDGSEGAAGLQAV